MDDACPLCCQSIYGKDRDKLLPFKDVSSLAEYLISGLCQECQDGVFKCRSLDNQE